MLIIPPNRSLICPITGILDNKEFIGFKAVPIIPELTLKLLLNPVSKPSYPLPKA